MGTHNASTSHHTSDSDFTDFSNGTFSNDGYHDHGHNGHVSYTSDQDIYTHSDDFGYQRYYTDGHSYDSFSDGHFGPDGHYGHGIYGDAYGPDHFHGAAYNGHDYGNVDEFINGGALAYGTIHGYNIEDLGYGHYADYVAPHSYDAYRPVHQTYTGLSHYTKPNYSHYDYNSPLS